MPFLRLSSVSLHCFSILLPFPFFIKLMMLLFTFLYFSDHSNNYELAPPRFYRSSVISADRITASSYNRKAWYVKSCLSQDCCHLSTNAKQLVNWQFWRDLRRNKQTIAVVEEQFWKPRLAVWEEDTGAGCSDKEAGSNADRQTKRQAATQTDSQRGTEKDRKDSRHPLSSLLLPQSSSLSQSHSWLMQWPLEHW